MQNLAAERFLIRQWDHVRLAARTDRDNEAIKRLRRISIDDPPTGLVPIHFGDTRLEPCIFAQAVRVPDLALLSENVVTTGVNGAVKNERVEAVHDRTGLQVACRVDVAPNTTLSGPLFKNCHVKAVTLELRGR